MTEVLLKELNNSDIDWLLGTGRRQDLAAGTQLVQAGQPLDCLHILIEGSLVSTVPQIDNNPLARAFAALDDGHTAGVEIARLSSGEVVGEMSLINLRPPATTVTAIASSQVLSIPLLQLEAKLESDIDFAARFYRALAILLSDKLETIITRLGRTKLAPDSSIKDVLFLFGELNDSDLDWFIANGDRQKFAVNTTLVKEGGAVDALHILLSGQISLSVTEDDRNPLTRIFAAIEDNLHPAIEIARLSKGEMVGETAFIDGRLPATTATITKETITLSISRSLLSAKLQQDIGFTARFYRTISALSADRLQGMLTRLAHSRRLYHKGQSLNESEEYADELNGVALDRMALAGKRFDWMLEQSKAS
ncbi:MAG TPA: cyclic nucleotide-binding domain-containing protein [Coleofasciculaceae cyanobacterium]|jgi:bacteriocin-type transport-associated protein